jgi:EF-P beta-lysylation protein EpmB
MQAIEHILSQPWPMQLRHAVRSSAELAQFLELPELATQARHKHFPLVVTHSFMQRMQKRAPDDPLLKQILPTALEDEASERGMLDPVGDQAARASQGLIHKYESRALLMSTSACAVHCRYCFRRNFPYAEEVPKSEQEWEAAFAYIAKHPHIREIILSGGDPLSLSDERLAKLIDRIDHCPQIKYLRIHTRMPVVLPARVSREFLDLLRNAKQNVVMVLHVNHANELRGDCLEALDKLRSLPIQLLNQSVLLRGINDSVETLCDLSEALFAHGILPYYLHRLDKVQGGMHFEVGEEQGMRLIAGMQAKLPGYLVPKFVREDAGASSKTLIF